MKIHNQFSLKNHNTFGIDATSRFYAEVNTPDQLNELINNPIFLTNRRLILGGGSNILFLNDFDGFTAQINLRGKSPEFIDENTVELKVMAGEPWEELVEFCVNNNWGGIENLTLIPGNTGTAPIQNIGAYGREIKDCIKYVEAIEISSGLTTNFSKSDCQFGYRTSIFKTIEKDRYIITSVTLVLSRQHHTLNFEYAPVRKFMEEREIVNPGIRDIMEGIQTIRRAKLPDYRALGNAGSFFKNPVIENILFEKIKDQWPEMPYYPAEDERKKIPAAWLIENCGWKGYRKGSAGVHHNQPLVLINHGNATGTEIWALAMEISDSVAHRFGIVIEPEVNVIS